MLVVFLSVGLLHGSAAGATRRYSTGPLSYPLPDAGTTAVRLLVPDSGPISYLEVSLRIDNPRDSDLTLTLVSPARTLVVLTTKRDGKGRNYGNGAPCGYGATLSSSEGETPIGRGKPPFTYDIFEREQSPSRLYGEEASGQWQLRITDDTAGAAGTLRCFKLLVSRDILQTQTARARDTEAQLEFHERTGTLTGLRLRIERGGRAIFDAPPKRLEACTCPDNGPLVQQSGGALHVRDVDGDGEPEVVIDSYWGAPHCCFYTDVYRYVRRLDSYRPAIGFWGNVPSRLVDIGLDGRPEFKTADNRFAYAFTSFAGSAFPIQIFRFDHGRFVDVTRRYRTQVRRDAARLFALYRSERHKPEGDIGGILPAWLAEQYLLGRGSAGWPVLEGAVRRGELDAFEEPRTYLRRVRSFLRRTGYIRS